MLSSKILCSKTIGNFQRYRQYFLKFFSRAETLYSKLIHYNILE